MKIQKQHLCYSFFTGIDETATVDLKRPKPEELALNSEVLLKCQINGNPDLLFDWYRNTFRLAEEQQKRGKILHTRRAYNTPDMLTRIR